MGRLTTTLTPKERRQLVEAPFAITRFGGRGWSGLTFRDPQMHYWAQRGPSPDYSYSDERFSNAGDNR